MNKTPIAIALERQIPEYIRGEYELFVNFIKAYYEFLNQTQQRNLEDIRSIENTLDEFIVRFKKELSVLFPTNSITDERFILQRIREFYQARGSKESYQFLFKILFNKDSDVFYPSTQILRASDGKWVQEKSIFVKSESGNLFNLSSKIINITTSNKQIHVFCPRVVYYRKDIYEVFIDRSYVQDIQIGNLVSSEDGSVYGNIIPTPNKYTITSEGSGFEVGSLYYLKTEKGDGSLVKITKIGTNGSIKKIQVISFGLDYDSTFYAKLSNKKAEAFPYKHPVPGPYPDGNTGFVDYGYISKQDYFYFDSLYEPSVENNQNVFYADATYVGDIVASFYTNASNTNVIGEDTAEIKIELGAVAIYPGYYSSSDGFVSDESYIQDGKYYQLFSYVIKVEEQLSSYYDIVKELLHPAGLELYAEYTIRNNYIVAASPLLAFIRRQFLEQEFVTDDEGTNEIYKTSNDSSPAIHTNLQDIKDVLQPKSDILQIESSDFRYNDVSKIIETLDAIVDSLDDRYHDVLLSKSESTTQNETYLSDYVTGTIVENAIPFEGPRIFELSGDTWKDAIYVIDDNVVPDKLPYYADAIYTSSYYSNGVQYPDADVFNSVVSYYRSGAESVVPIESGRDWAISGSTFNKSVSTTDSTPARGNDKPLSELINITIPGTLYANPYSQEGISVYDYFAETYGIVDTRALS